jgi:hypothetical protein
MTRSFRRLDPGAKRGFARREPRDVSRLAVRT